MLQSTPSIRTDSLRYLFWGFWFFLLPGAIAYGGTVWLSGHPAMGPLYDFAQEQRVPTGIVLFTLAEGVVWYFRHRLPYAEPFAAARPGLPAELRPVYEEAGHLVDEVDRIFTRHGRAIVDKLGESTRDEVAEGVGALRDSMDAEPFDRERFERALARAQELTEGKLDAWRKGELREYAESIGVAIVVALLLRAVVLEAFKIPSGSMLPTLQIGDHIFVVKFAYGPKLPLVGTRILENMPPERGDVMVFEYPDPNERNERQDYIKRVIAIPGDTLEAERGHPIINGWRVPNCRVGHYEYGASGPFGRHNGELFVEYLGEAAFLALYRNGGAAPLHQGPFHVKPGEVWVMGDNRNNSLDSRAWLNADGTHGAGVPYANIKGRAFVVWLPLDRLLLNVMGDPTLPSGSNPQLVARIEECLKSRPPLSETTPPPPGGGPVRAP